MRSYLDQFFYTVNNFTLKLWRLITPRVDEHVQQPEIPYVAAKAQNGMITQESYVEVHD